MQKVIKRDESGLTSHGFRVSFTFIERKEEDLIGVTVPSVRLGRKRLLTLLGAFGASLGSVWGQSKPKGAQG